MGDRISILSEKLYLLSLSDLKERIARYLLTISRGEEKFKIPITKEELSKILGVTRPSLSRTFSELTKEGIIEQIRSEIIIRDIERLKKLIKE
ncbi:MAG TPA: helix-turn-helix domain-containing protein [Thermotogaceae bacterium]|nr:helix-turn-helix domain-containing protein [Thermotogaceae bacterium]